MSVLSGRVAVGDVVRVHTGNRLYAVLSVVEDAMYDMTTGAPTNASMARVEPVDPTDERPAQWVNVDLLHVAPPVATIRTKASPLWGVRDGGYRVGGVLAVEGHGWNVRFHGRLRTACVYPLAGGGGAPPVYLEEYIGQGEPIATVRIGSTIKVDDHCYRVTAVDSEGPWAGEPELTPIQWRHGAYAGGR